MNDKHTITLTTDELNLVLAALGELPAKHTMQLISNLVAQAKEQLNQHPGLTD